MNAKIYEYGTADNGLSRRLVRSAVVIQEETDSNDKPSVVVHLRLQTYTVVEGETMVVTDVTDGYKVVKGEVPTDVNGVALLKNDLEGNPVFEEDGVTRSERDNAYENIVALQSMNVSSDTILDLGIKEYYNII
tara:strand:- start:89 stop:490 length:402 start_codon:yes stop_codon:yes gene_type:complete